MKWDFFQTADFPLFSLFFFFLIKNQRQWQNWLLNCAHVFCITTLCGWGLFDDVICISDYTAEDSQQSLCKRLQGLWPRGLVSISTQIIQSFWHVSTWCKNVQQYHPAGGHSQDSSSVCFISLRCHMPWMFTGYCLKSQSTVPFCHWQITRHFCNCHNGVNSTHLVSAGSWKQAKTSYKYC